MKPDGIDLLHGVQASLMTYILPEVQSPYARQELMLVNALLGIAANDWDGAAQRLVDENASLRALAGRLAGAPDGGAAGLDALAREGDASLRLRDLSAANAALREALARAAAADGTPASLRREVIEALRRDLEARAYPLLGPRADG